MSRRILIVDDDKALSEVIRDKLVIEGFDVECATDADEALRRSESLMPDLVLLDVMLPKSSGFDLVPIVRRSRKVPIIFLSARGLQVDKLRGLEAGADDYITKPFGIGELRARLRVALRRTGGGNANYELDGLSIDIELRRIQRAGQDIHLTPIEFALLARLARSAGRVVTHRQLLSDVWGAEYVDHTHYLRIYMGQLRAKIESDPAVPRFLLTETGIGYRLAAE